ncbi:hypothetical protein [Hymenobacter lucidus]|uniref:Lipocalin-like domain-containing protein n=1 Tax=Hymenobacter lucidus TaxID=2880930 RepID=A0ABS8AYE0_9BACT|nr:hypothetical protein [Hymenobacter lucidus]MCB2410793.1 hypothetical protein [Hymenobacter lucidus]
MKNFLQNASATFTIVLLLAGSTSLQAQNRIDGTNLVQQGNGAYVQKTDRALCIGNSLLGIPSIPANGCVNMTQEKFMFTPSGHAMAVWTATLPEAQRPAQRVVFNSTWTETNSDGVTRTYTNVTVTEPNGSVKLTMNDKENGKGKMKAKGKK